MGAFRYFAAIGLGASVLVRCMVDDRELGAAPPPLETSGAGGTDAMLGVITAGQGGVDASGVVTSWRFDHDVSGWQAEDGVDQSWSNVDASRNANSGSLLVSNAVPGQGTDFRMAGTSVCMPVEGGVDYDVAAEIYIDPGQKTGGGGLDVEFFNAPDCEGLLLDLTDFLTATTGKWQLGEKQPTAPQLAKSALFRLVATKLETDPPFAVRFDDVHFEVK
jgi:hypothetical protein